MITEHQKRSRGLPYDHTKLLEEKQRMKEEHEKIQQQLPRPIPFDAWYERAWVFVGTK